ncbi:hypothetical protein NP233_g3566 [Leucocoprinus birnbaumii]|uniref:G domain-containing protein n=1 Tax=Leucocoprinus birnbaumii TaxID=56174 RepID=A0AAD5VXQ4_9AGAR|nr:hypothetical protein NP233_g3566 [Leucocoprinus birnbaumii]
MGVTGSSRRRIHRPDAIIIVVCGKAGAGKSTFINVATRSNTLPVNHAQSPQPGEVLHVTIGELARARFKDKIIFLEIPPLVSLESEEETALEQSMQDIFASLRNEFHHIRICGFLYLHPITDSDLPDSRSRYWSLLTRLRKNKCVDSLPGSTILVTTKWEWPQSECSESNSGLDDQRKRQKELRTYWQRLPREPLSSIVMSFHEFYERAWLIIAASMDVHDGDVLRKAMVREGKRQSWEKWEENESKWEWEEERRSSVERELLARRSASGRRTNDRGTMEGSSLGKDATESNQGDSRTVGERAEIMSNRRETLPEPGPSREQRNSAQETLSYWALWLYEFDKSPPRRHLSLRFLVDIMAGILGPLANSLKYITTTKVHPAFPYLIGPTVHAARISIAYQANARKSPDARSLSWGTYIAGYLIMCWGGGLSTHFLLGLPPPMLYSFGPWINYLTVHLVLTAVFTFFPSLLHPPTFDTALFPLDALVRTTAIIGSVSLLSPSSAAAKQINPLYVNSPLTHMIVGALASAGGGLAASTLGAWSSQWSFSTPPVLRLGVGMWGSLDVWGGALVAAVYGISTNHPAFRTFIPTLLKMPIFSQLIQLIYPFFDTSLEGLAPLKPAEARALGGLVLTVLFALRVYNVHWSGAASPSKGKADTKQSGGKKGVAAKAQ